MTMDARKQRVLQAIVALYGLEGEPVGSSVLANYFDMAVSSATLRNEMAALTKLGLLEQPHTRLSHSVTKSSSGTRRSMDTVWAASTLRCCLPSMLCHWAAAAFCTSVP